VILTKYYFGDAVNEGEMGGACTCIGELRNAYEILVRKPEG